MTDPLPTGADVVVAGAGIVGAACALALARAGMAVCVLDRTVPTGGASGAGEGNVLVSDKLPGPELALALRSAVLWRRFADAVGGIEYEPKGGLVVAHDSAAFDGLVDLAAGQRAAGARAEPVPAADLAELEPHLSDRLAGGVLYPQDCQVQPMLATMAHLTVARQLGATLTTHTEVLGAETSPDGAIVALTTSRGRVETPMVVNAAGPWSAALAGRLGSALPVRPRRGHVLVTAPLPPTVRHKVYAADYVATVNRDDPELACSAVVEATVSGTLLLGSSRELAGFDRVPSMPVLAEIARRAIALFPFLARVPTLRAYVGFRPATPDHLPVIGADPAVRGLVHATGHEGAGVGLAPATGELVAALLTGTPAAVDPAPFSPARFGTVPHLPGNDSGNDPSP